MEGKPTFVNLPIKSLVFKGKAQLKLENVILDDARYLIDSPSFYFVF